MPSGENRMKKECTNQFLSNFYGEPWNSPNSKTSFSDACISARTQCIELKLAVRVHGSRLSWLRLISSYTIVFSILYARSFLTKKNCFSHFDSRISTEQYMIELWDFAHRELLFMPFCCVSFSFLNQSLRACWPHEICIIYQISHFGSWLLQLPTICIQAD